MSMRVRACATCRYWSEQIARINGGGPLEAYCLAPPNEATARYAKTYTRGSQHCAAWASGHLGAIDDPLSGDPARYDKLSSSA